MWLKPASEACPGRDSNSHQDFKSVTGLKKRPYGEIEPVSPSLTPAAPNDHWPQEGFRENTTCENAQIVSLSPRLENCPDLVPKAGVDLTAEKGRQRSNTMNISLS